MEIKDGRFIVPDSDAASNLLITPLQYRKDIGIGMVHDNE